MSFDDFVQRGMARVKAKLGLAGNRVTPSFDDLHAAVGEVLQHVADEVPAAAALPPATASGETIEAIAEKIEAIADMIPAMKRDITALIDTKVAAAIAALPPPVPVPPTVPLSATIDQGAPMDKSNAGLPSGEFGSTPPPLPPVPPLPPAASPPIGA